MKRSGFTLIELLVVIAIITILASFLTPAFRRGRMEALEKKGEACISAICTAIAMYEADVGFLPASGFSNLSSALTGSNPDPDWNGPYYTPRGGAAGFEDPWGNNYVYTNNGTTYDLSCGSPHTDISN